MRKTISKADIVPSVIPESMSEMSNSPPSFTFIELFAGIGGFRLGMESNGGECVFANEWDKHAAKTYSAWFGAKELNTDDLRSLDFKTEIPDHDLLTAGFPCQPFSLAGVSKKNSLGRAHGFQDANQGNLFLSIAEIARIKRPKIMLLENVKNLKSHDKGTTWKVILESLDSIGYEVRTKVIDAIEFVPQHRERVFIVCFNREVFSESDISTFSFPETLGDRPKLASILEESPDPKYMLSDKLWAYLQSYAEKHRAKGNGFGYQVVDDTMTSRTLSARYHKDGSEILIRHEGWSNPRRLTPNEARLLMGYDKEFERYTLNGQGFPQVTSDTQAFRQFGNSVVPQVVREIGRQIAPLLWGTKLR